MDTWKSSIEIDALIETFPDVKRLNHFFLLHKLWSNAIYTRDYVVDKRWQSYLNFLPEGKKLAEFLKKSLGESYNPDFCLALFNIFFHYDLIFDWQTSKIDEIEELLSDELIKERIRFPYRFGRTLYDRFNDVHQSTRTEHLPSNGVYQLLEGTPQGVYQVGTVLIGPLGLLQSEEIRYLPPTKSLPLWHCSDTGCNAFHRVKLEEPDIPLLILQRRIRNLLREKMGTPSEWDFCLRRLHRKEEWEAGRLYSDLPELIGDCIVGNERNALTNAALVSENSKHLREILSSPPRKKSAGEGSASDVVDRLGQEEQLQLLLVMQDEILIKLIDDVVVKKEIVIPLGERREAKSRYNVSGRDSNSILSDFGIRSSKENPILRLSSLIWDAYEYSNLINELDWRVGNTATLPSRTALFEYLRNKGPAEAVNSLILTSRDVTSYVCKKIRLALDLTSSVGHKSINILLWKLGFNPEEYDDSIERAFSRLRDFQRTVIELSPIESEDAREKIRSVGVNLFVSLEDFLDKLISYNVWLLSSDHFLNKFKYDNYSSRCSIRTELGGVLSRGTETYTWSIDGENSLGTLLCYLSESEKWMNALEESDRDSILRPKEDLPHYIDNPHAVFPFRRTKLWADSDITELKSFINNYQSIAKVFQQSDAASIRNGIDHYRDERTFPDSDRILGCIARIETGLIQADNLRFYPKPYWLRNIHIDRFHQIQYEFKDYQQRSLYLYGPSSVSGLPSDQFMTPVLIAPGNLIGFPNSHIRLEINEKSEYAKYWEGYPRRRKITPNGNDS